MDSNELREACDMAGLEVVEWLSGPSIRRYESMWVVLVEGHSRLSSDAMLPAYVAELLTAKVRERGGLGALEVELESECWDDQTVVAATAEQRIRAAMAVLGGGE